MTGVMRAWRRVSETLSPRPRTVRWCLRPPCRTWCPERSPLSHFLHRCQKIFDQIVWMLESGRKSDQSVADAELGTLLRRESLMRGRCRMGDKALRVAEVVGDPDELQRIEKAKCAFLAAFDLELAERGSCSHLLLDDIGLRMFGPAGIDQSRDLLVAGKCGCDRAGAVGLPLDAYRQGLKTLEQDPRVERRQRWTGLPQDLMVVIEDQFFRNQNATTENP